MADKLLEKRISEHIEAAKALQSDKALLGKVQSAADAILSAYAKGGKLITMGNGGSAADAQHIAAEFLGRYMLERKPKPAIALTTNTSNLTAIGNDYGYDTVFSRQLEGWLSPNDVVLGISTSGNSANIVKAFEYAKSKGAFTIALVGKKPCKLDSLASVSLKMPSESTPRIQEMHIFIAHFLCEYVEAGFVEKKLA
ncbi:MAG: SIS domain-containing protein [Candidatus Micrarchaeia archaeon]